MKKFAPLFIILAGCLWGTMGLFVRHLNAMGLSSMEVVETRSVLAAGILFLFTFFRDRRLLKVQRNQLWPLICSGLFSILFFNYCYFSTIAIMDMSAAAILLYTAPIFVMLLSLVFFREKLTLRKVVALLVAFGGCCLVSGIGSSSARLTAAGLLLGLGSGIGYALYSIFSRFSLNQGLNSITITDYTFLFASIGGLFFADLPSILSAFRQYGLSLLGFMVIYVLVTTVAPYLLYTYGLKHVENGVASVLASVEPVIATILGFLVFSESPTISSLLGILLVMLALILLSISHEEENQ